MLFWCLSYLLGDLAALSLFCLLSGITCLMLVGLGFLVALLVWCEFLVCLLF